MPHAGMKSHKEKASVRLTFARKDSKENETVEPSSSSSSEQSRTEKSVLKHHRKVLSKCLSRTFYGKDKTNRPTSDDRQET